MPNYYPIMLDVRGRQAIVVGGNHIAAEKASALSASGAHVTVLSPELNDELRTLAQQRKIKLQVKTYEPGDLAHAFVVVAATDDPQLIEAIWQETQQRGQLVNIVDMPAYCNFIMPSILRREQLTIAVSTEGASPSLAKRIRQQLERLFPPAYGTYLRLAGILRAYLRLRGLSYSQRDKFFEDYYNSNVLVHLEKGHEPEAIAVAVDLMQHYNIDISTTTIEAEMREAVNK